jgi:1,4-dihydroxy-2-naphthoate octaprenyltransferase
MTSEGAARPPLPRGAKAFWLGARPRTLGASIVPVLVGSAPFESFLLAGLALLVGVGMQVGVNYANDYFDGVRGVDTAERLGPPRMVAMGMASPRAVATAAGIAFAIAAVAGLVLALLTSLWLLLIGAIALLAAVLYSGGPRPYAGLGLGEVAVFAFFGLVATVGSAYVQLSALPAELRPAGLGVEPEYWLLGAGIGVLAVAILVANNLRDIPTDAASGKRTLAVRLGREQTLRLFAVTIFAPPAVIVTGVLIGQLPPSCSICVVSLPLGLSALSRARVAQGREFTRVLLGTAAYQAAFGLLLFAALVTTFAIEG